MSDFDSPATTSLLPLPRLTRRETLSILTGIALGSAISPSHAAQPATDAPRKSGPIGLGFSLYGCPGMMVETSLRFCREVGYDSVELAVLPGYGAEPDQLDATQRKQIRTLLGELPLRLSAVMENLSATSSETDQVKMLDRLKKAGRLAHDVGAVTPPIVETVCGGQAGQWDQLRNQMRDRIGQWAEEARRLEIQLAIKPHASGAMNRPEQALWLLDQLRQPALKLVYDFSHYDRRGFTIDQTMQALLPQTVFVHVKDRDPKVDDIRFLLPGEGPTDYTHYLKTLAGLGYQGDVVVEVSGQIHRQPGYDAKQAITTCHARLSPAWNKAQVERRAALKS